LYKNWVKPREAGLYPFVGAPLPV